MDVADFVREFSRMCKSMDACDECPFDYKCGDPESLWASAEKLVGIVAEWSKEHPVQTNWDKFKEVFGRMGYPDLVRAEPGVTIYASAWWDEPYKAPKEE